MSVTAVRKFSKARLVIVNPSLYFSVSATAQYHTPMLCGIHF